MKSRLVLTGLVLLLCACDAMVGSARRTELARQAETEGDFGRAIVEMRRVVQDEPESIEAHLYLANLAGKAGEADLQEREARAVLALDSSNVPAAWLAADSILARNQPQLVLRELERGVWNPPADEALGITLRALLRVGDVTAARTALQARSASEPAGLSLSREMARLEIAEGRLADASSRLKDLLEQYPQDVELAVMSARLAGAAGDFADSKRQFESLLERAPADIGIETRAAALTGLVEAALSVGDTEEAARRMAELRKMLPDALATQFLSGRVALAQGRNSEAIAELQRLVVGAPEFAPGHFLLGVGQLAEGNVNQAERALANAVRLAPENSEARKLLARARLQLKRPDEAIQALGLSVGAEELDPQTAALLGAAQFQKGDPRDAVATFEAALAKRPDDIGARMDLAVAYVFANRPSDALAQIARVPDAQGGVRKLAIWLMASEAAGGPARARAEFEALLRQRPRDFDTSLLAGAYYERQGDRAAARQWYETANLVRPQEAAPMLALARLALTAGDLEEARKWASAAAALPQASPLAYRQLAEVQWRRKDAQAARATLAAGIAAHPDDRLLALAQVRLHYLANDISGGDKALDQLLNSAPNDAALRDASGQMLFELRRYDQALARYRQAVDIDQGNAGYWSHLAAAQLARGDTAAAKESYERAHSLQPKAPAPVTALTAMDIKARRFDDAAARLARYSPEPADRATRDLLLGDVTFASGKPADALKYYESAEAASPSALSIIRQFQAKSAAGLAEPQAPLERWLATHPNDAVVLAALVDAQLTAKRFTEARAHAEALVAVLPGSQAALNNLAWIYQQLGDSRALPTAEKAYAIDPRQPQIADTLGWILLETGNTGRAVSLLEQAAKAAPNDAEVQYHLAAALAKAGQKAQAKAILERLMSAAPQFESRGAAAALLASL